MRRGAGLTHSHKRGLGKEKKRSLLQQQCWAVQPSCSGLDLPCFSGVCVKGAKLVEMSELWHWCFGKGGASAPCSRVRCDPLKTARPRIFQGTKQCVLQRSWDTTGQGLELDDGFQSPTK